MMILIMMIIMMRRGTPEDVAIGQYSIVVVIIISI